MSTVFVPNRRIADKRFVTQAVNESEMVKEFSISAGAKHGDNVMGKLLSVDVKTKSNDIINLVIKSVLPMTGVIDKNTLSSSAFIASLQKFPNEIQYYAKIREVFLEAIQKSNCSLLINQSSLFSSPKYYSSFTDADGLNDYLALEDLRPWGYKMSNKFKGLSFEEVTTTLKAVAVLHATSFTLLSRNHEEFSQIQKDPNSTFNSHVWERLGSDYSLFNSILGEMIEIIRDNGDVDIARKMQRYAEEGYKILLDLSKKTGTCDKYFRVLIHGDLWTNNILFKKEFGGGSVEDVKFVDFQDSRFGNVYEELHYFLFTSTTAEFRKDHLKSSLGVYFKEFSSACQGFQTELPKGFSEEELISTFVENMEYGFCYNLVAIPFQLGLQAPPPSPMTPIDIHGGNAFFPSEPSLDQSSANNNDSELKSNSVKTETDFRQIMVEMTKSLQAGVRSSPIAQKRIKEMLNEAIEYGLIM